MGVREDAEACPWHVLGRLDDRSAKLRGPPQGRFHVLNTYEEQNFVLGALTRADGHVRAALDSGVDKRVARERPLGRHLSPEQIGKELAGGVRVFRADLGVNNGMCHEKPPASRDVDLPIT